MRIIVIGKEQLVTKIQLVAPLDNRVCKLVIQLHQQHPHAYGRTETPAQVHGDAEAVNP